MIRLDIKQIWSRFQVSIPGWDKQKHEFKFLKSIIDDSIQITAEFTKLKAYYCEFRAQQSVRCRLLFIFNRHLFAFLSWCLKDYDRSGKTANDIKPNKIFLKYLIIFFIRFYYLCSHCSILSLSTLQPFKSLVRFGYNNNDDEGQKLSFHVIPCLILVLNAFNSHSFVCSSQKKTLPLESLLKL